MDGCHAQWSAQLECGPRMASRPGPGAGTSPDDGAQAGQTAHGWIGASERKPNDAVIPPIRHTGAPGEESARKFQSANDKPRFFPFGSASKRKCVCPSKKRHTA